MKKIFVSVGEFLENGGKLKENRDIYIDNNGKFVAIGIGFKVIEGNANWKPEISGQGDIVDVVWHEAIIGGTDYPWSAKRLRGFIRLV